MHRTGQGNATVLRPRHQRGTAAAGATNEIGIVLYPGVQAACVHGLTDLFEIAANIARDQQRDGRSPLRVTHWQPAHSRDTKLSCVYDSDPYTTRLSSYVRRCRSVTVKPPAARR